MTVMVMKIMTMTVMMMMSRGCCYGSGEQVAEECRARPKYQQPMNLRPHILPLVWQAWDLGADGAVFVASIVTQT